MQYASALDLYIQYANLFFSICTRRKSEKDRKFVAQRDKERDSLAQRDANLFFSICTRRETGSPL
jgi:hypothetical protein